MRRGSDISLTYRSDLNGLRLQRSFIISIYLMCAPHSDNRVLVVTTDTAGILEYIPWILHNGGFRGETTCMPGLDILRFETTIPESHQTIQFPNP